MEQRPILMPRPLTQQDLQWLVCPVCRATLRLETPRIVCTGCSRHYPIVEGLPVLLAERIL